MSVNKYVDLLSRYGLYGENGYYIDSHIIHRMVVDELKLAMSFRDIEEFINNCEISITGDEIKNTLKSRYRFDLYSLQYFKTYTSILKEKCKILFEILEDLAKIKEGTISQEGWNRIVDLDFHINEYGDIYIADAERLVDAIIYNVKDLYEKIAKGNDPETYLTFKETKHDIAKYGSFENEIYPRKDVQIKDEAYGYRKEFISLTDDQKEKLRQDRLDVITKMRQEDFLDNDPQDSHDLVKIKGKFNNKNTS